MKQQKERENHMSNTTLDKMVEIKEQAELCSEFLDWFLQKYTVFERRTRENPYENVMGAGDYINKEKLLAEFFEINLQEAEKERQALLRQLQQS